VSSTALVQKEMESDRKPPPKLPVWHLSVIDERRKSLL
jgi:hypothetical protein